MNNKLSRPPQNRNDSWGHPPRILCKSERFNPELVQRLCWKKTKQESTFISKDVREMVLPWIVKLWMMFSPVTFLDLLPLYLSTGAKRNRIVSEWLTKTLLPLQKIGHGNINLISLICVGNYWSDSLSPTPTQLQVLATIPGAISFPLFHRII